MDFIRLYLQQNWHRLGLEPYGLPEDLTYILATPRFRTSRHVVFLFLTRSNHPKVVLVAKLPRLKSLQADTEREAANLNAVQAAHSGNLDTAPRVLAAEAHRGQYLLLETAIDGQPLSPIMLRRDVDSSCGSVIDWLVQMQQPTRTLSTDHADWFDHLVEQPLTYFTRVFPLTRAEGRLLEKAYKLVTPLHLESFPLFFEHGDLSHPNLVIMPDGRIGVLDWELAEPKGMPAHDLFFFLTYAAVAQINDRHREAITTAFHQAFFRKSSWTAPYIKRYVQQTALSPQLLKPLFVLCWTRYVGGLLKRVNGPAQQTTAETAVWLRSNRYYKLWRHTLEHVTEISL